jgi:hypothetical protein
MTNTPLIIRSTLRLCLSFVHLFVEFSRHPIQTPNQSGELVQTDIEGAMDVRVIVKKRSPL